MRTAAWRSVLPISRSRFRTPASRVQCCMISRSVAVFAVASYDCAVAVTLTWLLVARGLQGMGAALLMPNSLAILGGAFSGATRGRAIGIWAAMDAVTGAAGPILGGWLIDTVGWRAIFLLNLPLAVAAIGLAKTKRIGLTNPLGGLL